MANPVPTDIWRGGDRPPNGGGFGGGDDGSAGRGASRRASVTGLMVLLAAVVMFFAALTSAFIVRRGLSSDWEHTQPPRIIFLSTAVLLASSALLEFARRAVQNRHREEFQTLAVSRCPVC